MKKIVLVSSLIFFIASLVTLAQPRFSVQDRLKLYKEKLNLTEEQTIKIEKILVNSGEELNKLRNSETRDREGFRKIMDNSNQEIEKVLDDKQKIEFNKMLDEMKNRRQQNLNKMNK